jgi:hypothetical protein
MTIRDLACSLLLLTAAAIAPAADAPAADPACEECAIPPSAAATNAEFKRIKELVGTWELVDPEQKQSTPVHVEYALTSNGNAVTQKDFAGTEHEMLSVWFVKGGKLHLIHYCHLDNRPEMELVSSDDTSLRLDLVAGSVADPNEQHMHALTVTRADADHLRNAWDFFDQGSKQGVADFEFVRVKKP